MRVKPFALLLTAIVSGIFGLSAVRAAPEIGEPAPAFTGRTSQGDTLSLERFAGRTVVMEWTNHGCPFVQKHYDTGNMQAVQKQAHEEHTVVWLTIISSAPGKQGHVTPAEAQALTQSYGAMVDATLLDPDGTIGRAYDAKTTPQMAVIDGEGVLRYYGAIDDQPSARHKTVESAENYVLAALDAMAVGEEPDPAQTRPYGCSVKY